MTCPCLLADEPCRPDCSCVNPLMSCGCLCCCTYGSPKQQKHQANMIVSKQRLHTILCVGEHGHGENPQIDDCPKCVEEEMLAYKDALKEIYMGGTNASSAMQLAKYAAKTLERFQ